MLVLGELTARLKVDKTQFKQGLAQGERDFRQSGRQLERDADATAKAMAAALAMGGQRGADGFARGADGRLRDARGRFVAAGADIGRAAGTAAAGGLSSLSNVMGSVAGGAVNVSTNLWNLIPLVAALGTAAVFAGPAVYALGGALGSLPALAIGGGAAIGTLAIGFQGLSEAFRKTARSGGSVVDRAYQVARAERQVRDANREVLDSQLALNRARQAAAENLQDLNRSLASARLDEESAVLAVSEAERDLREARRGRDPLEIQRAELALRQAQQAVLDVRDRVEDLAAEQADASRKGVEGSDEVTAALRRQEQAVQGVKDAEHALAQSRKGSGAGGAAGETTRLAASAATLVAVLKGLKPAWEDLRLSVQERLFAGIGAEVQLLAGAWLPKLKTGFGSMADTFNGLFKQFSGSARDPEFMKNIGVGLESVRVLIGKVGGAIAGPGVKAFGQLAKAAGPFLTFLGDKLAGVVESFATWIDGADKSGALTGFFETAAKYLGDIWDIGEDVVVIIKDLFGVWAGSEVGAGFKDLFDTFKTGLSDLREWLSDPENKQRLTDIYNAVTKVSQAAMEFVGWLIETGLPAAAGVLLWFGDIWVWIVDKATKAKDWIVSKWDALVGFVKGLPGKISSAASGLWDGIKDGFKSALNWIIGKWNGLSFTLPGFSAFGQQIGGGTLGTPNIPYLDVGGRILGSGLAVVHQGEVVVPAAQVRRLERGGGFDGGGGGAQQVDVKVTVDTPEGGVLKVVRHSTRVQGGRLDRVLVGAGSK